jgi:ATP-dependent DNA ligase
VLGVDGISDFNALLSRKHDHEVQLYAFDCLAYDGDDLCRLPLHLHKTNLAQLLRGRAEGICRMGLEGLVSKHRERAYRGGRCDHWVKVKNRKHPAFSRVADQF